MAVDIGPKIGIQGEQEFRKELKQINEGIKTLGSEMKVVTSEFTNQEKSVESLTKENDVLNRTINSLNDKLDLQKKMLEESAKAYGEADERTMKWQQAVNKTQAELNTATAKVKENEKAMDDLGKEVDDTTESFDDGAKGATTFGEVLKANLASQAIISGVKALGSAIKGAVEGLAGMVTDAAGAADEILTLSTQTGLSTDQIQKFQYASELIDVPLETLTGSLSKLTKQMASAQGGTGDAADTFAELGVAVTNADGSLRDNEDVFKDTIAALGKIDNETERDAKAMKIFGKSAQDLNPLILGGADALQQYGEEAEKAGLILSEGELSDLGSVQDNMDRLTQSIDMAKTKLVSSFAEPVSEALNVAVSSVQRLSQAFAEGGWEGLAQEMGSVVTEAVQYMTEHLDEITGFATTLVSTLVKGISTALPSIGQAAADIVVALVEMLAECLPQLATSAVDMVMTLVENLLSPESLQAIVGAALDLVVNLATGLVDAIPKIVERLPEIITGIIEGLLAPEMIAKIIQAGIDLIVNLVGNIPEIVSGLVNAIPEILSGLVNGFLSEENLQKLYNLGLDMMNKIWEGMKSVARRVAEWVTDVINGDNAPQSVKDFYMGELGGVNPEDYTSSDTSTSHGGGGTHWGDYYDPALGGTVILQTPEADTLATYITPSLGSATKAYGTPILNPYS